MHPHLKSSLTLLMLVCLQSTTPSFAFAADEQMLDLIEVGRAQLTKQQYNGALETFRKASGLVPYDPRPIFWIAETMSWSGQTREACDAYRDCMEKATALGLDSAELRIDVGNALSRLNYLDQAQFDYERALQIDPRLTIAHLYLGRVLLQKGLSKPALDQFELCKRAGLHDQSLSYLEALSRWKTSGTQ